MNRRYTDFYGANGDKAWAIAAMDYECHGVEDANDASGTARGCRDESKPLWYRGMLFNELYVLTDGGTFGGVRWFQGISHHRLCLECFDYAYYGTLWMSASVIRRGHC